MIYVHSKSGCCFHQTDGYKVVNNKPFKVYEHTIDGTVPNGGDDPKIMTKKLVNEKWLTWERASAAKVSFDKGKTSKTISVKLDKNEPVKWLGFGAAKGQILNLTVDSPGADVRIVDFKGDVSSYESYESLQEGKILPAKLTGNGDYYVEISAEQDITVNLTISIKNEKDK